MSTAKSNRLDRIKVSVIGNRLDAISKEIGQTMLRTSRSPIFSEARDFVTAIFDAKLRLVAQTAYIPVLMGALPYAMREHRETFEGDVDDGDIFILNDPFPRQQSSAGHHDPQAGLHGRADRLLGRLERPSRRCRRRRRRGLQPGREERLGGMHPDPAGQALRQGRAEQGACGTRSSSTSTCRSWSRATCNARSAPEDRRAQPQGAAGQIRPQDARCGHAADLRRIRGADARARSAVCRTAHTRRAPHRPRRNRQGQDDQGASWRSRSKTKASPSITPAATRRWPGYVNSTLAQHGVGLVSRAVHVDRLGDPLQRGRVACAACHRAGRHDRQRSGARARHGLHDRIGPGHHRVRLARARAGGAGAGRCRLVTLVRAGHDGPQPAHRSPVRRHSLHVQRVAAARSHGRDGWDHLGTVVCAGGLRAPDPELHELVDPFTVLQYEYWPDSAGAGEWRGGMGTIYRWRIDADGIPAANFGGGVSEATAPFGLEGGQPAPPHQLFLHKARRDDRSRRRELLPSRRGRRVRDLPERRGRLRRPAQAAGRTGAGGRRQRAGFGRQSTRTIRRGHRRRKPDARHGRDHGSPAQLSRLRALT